MRTFKKGNWGDKKCIICNTNNRGEVVLIPMTNTGDSPNKKFQNYEAIQVHLECLELWYDEEKKFIYQRIR